ncbi:MAG: hypothetical protein DHS20C17_00260 [Cyclobacteriaceae bacterium]|nr:MAG: hypothetical protein DHS20C17_00260 [Cyclobacteriaceae bacterium]
MKIKATKIPTLQRTENREQRTENREQRTENREQRTENREQSEGEPACRQADMRVGVSPLSQIEVPAILGIDIS